VLGMWLRRQQRVATRRSRKLVQLINPR
jgi:hypothetical protein